MSGKGKTIIKMSKYITCIKKILVGESVSFVKIPNDTCFLLFIQNFVFENHCVIHSENPIPTFMPACLVAAK
jgi:hypothetical protein